MAKTKVESVFDTDKKIKIGMWGLGRGWAFYRMCEYLNIEVVAGCEYNEHMRTLFQRANPEAFATDNADEFLARDFDAVLVATYCPAHADDAIRCLKAGKHVLSEVTAFHTMAEGVRLVEEVEKSGLVYNLSENYPFSAANMYLARKWREGLFGELMYAECEYLHEIQSQLYTNLDHSPLSRGDSAHSWRSWLNFHYYNTHSLGCVLNITGERPTRVVALPGEQRLPASLLKAPHGMGGVAPSLINMSNGSVVRNLMGATTNDGLTQRLWGTVGSAEVVDEHVRLRLGGRGESPKMEVLPRWDKFGEQAEKTGHSGGDFWAFYYFARQLLTGEPAPFDIYTAADCTIPGILAYRSQVEGGKPYDVPDFRDPQAREEYRHDDYAQPRYDTEKGCFSEGADYELTKHFSPTIRDLIRQGEAYRAYRDWAKVVADMKDPEAAVELVDTAIAAVPKLQETQKIARKIIERYPESDGAAMLLEALAANDEKITSHPGYLKELKEERRKLVRKVKGVIAARRREAEKMAKGKKWSSAYVPTWKFSKLLPKKGDVSTAKCVKMSDRLGWRTIHANAEPPDLDLVNVNRFYDIEDGICYFANKFKVKKKGTWKVQIGHDGGCQLFVDGESVMCVPERVNPAMPDRSNVTVELSKGTHEFMIAFDTDSGGGWGFYFWFEIPPSARKRGAKPEFPERLD